MSLGVSSLALYPRIRDMKVATPRGVFTTWVRAPGASAPLALTHEVSQEAEGPVQSLSLPSSFTWLIWKTGSLTLSK